MAPIMSLYYARLNRSSVAHMKWLAAALIVQLGAVCCNAAISSPLFARGYTVLPSPQKVRLGANDFEFTHSWRLEPGAGVKPDDMSVQSLREQLQGRFYLKLNGSGNAPAVHLVVAPNTVTVGAATDANKAAIAEQAYRIQLTPKA